MFLYFILYFKVHIGLRCVIYIYSKIKNNGKNQRSFIMLFAQLLSRIIQFFFYLSNEEANNKHLVWKQHESKTLKGKRAGAANKPVVVYFLIPR